MKDKANSSDHSASQGKTSPTTTAVPNHRVKTPGEKLFDVITYGGIGIGVNEAGSLVAMNLVKDGKIALDWLEKPKADWIQPVSKIAQKTLNFLNILKDDWIRPVYGKAQQLINKTPVLSEVEYFNKGRFLFLTTCLTGGMAMLLPTKWMEDSKSNIVRWFDRHVYGIKPENDQTVAKLHEEMDGAPKQSWRSLLEGRLTVIGAAFGLDVLIGKPDAVSTKLFEDTVFKDYSSADRAASSFARNIVDFFDQKGAEGRLKARRNASQPYNIQAREGNAVSLVKDASYLLTISVALMGLFYISSKLFAKGLAKKEAHEEAITKGEIPPDKEAAPAEDTSPEAQKPLLEATPSTAHPKTQVSQVARSEQRAQQGVAPTVSA